MPAPHVVIVGGGFGGYGRPCDVPPDGQRFLTMVAPYAAEGDSFRAGKPRLCAKRREAGPRHVRLQLLRRASARGRLASHAPLREGAPASRLLPDGRATLAGRRHAVAARRSFSVVHQDTSLKVDIFVAGRTPLDEEELERRQPLAGRQWRD